MKIENNMNNIYSGFDYLLDESDADFITPFKRNNSHDMRLLHTMDYYFAENYIHPTSPYSPRLNL